MRKIDLTGKVFNYLTALSRSTSDYRKWLCSCECGTTKEISASNLKNGTTKSCGCKTSELISKSRIKHGGCVNGKDSPAYVSYTAMLHRCYDIKRKWYNHYGGRGVVVCERWQEPNGKGFLNFLEDMGERPDGCSLDRVSSTGNYEPSNCRWVDTRLQAHNTIRNKTSNSSSVYRGVSFRKQNNTWVARIGNGRGGYTWLGEHPSEALAAMCYNDAATLLFGDSAILNIIE